MNLNVVIHVQFQFFRRSTSSLPFKCKWQQLGKQSAAISHVVASSSLQSPLRMQYIWFSRAGPIIIRPRCAIVGFPGGRQRRDTCNHI